MFNILSLAFFIGILLMLRVLVRHLARQTRLYFKRRRDRRHGQFRNRAHAKQHREKMFRRLDCLSSADRQGAIAVLSAITLMAMVAIFAMLIDYAYLGLVKAEAQRCADSAALAGAGALYVDHGNQTTVFQIGNLHSNLGHDTARRFVDIQNNARPQGYSTEPNTWNFATGDVVLGRMEGGELVPSDQPHAVRVNIILRNGHENGSLALFFPNLHANIEMTVSATARIDYPTLLPFSVYKGKWDTRNQGEDNYGNDGIPEVIVFPGKWNGDGLPPGNFGAIRIGAISSASILMEQIDKGPSVSDMGYYGNSISAGQSIYGQTGVNATVADAINGDVRYEGIIGQPRYLMLYSSASAQGVGATFIASRFVAVRIMAANLKSGTKFVAIQEIKDGAGMHNLRLIK